MEVGRWKVEREGSAEHGAQSTKLSMNVTQSLLKGLNAEVTSFAVLRRTRGAKHEARRWKEEVKLACPPELLLRSLLRRRNLSKGSEVEVKGRRENRSTDVM